MVNNFLNIENLGINMKNIFVVFIFLSFQTVLFADWFQTNGPEGGVIDVVAAGSNVSIAITASGKVYNNNGTGWMHVSTLNVIPGTRIISVGNTFLVSVSSYSVLKSSDNGVTWVQIFSSASGIAMAEDQGIAYVSVSDSIFKSTDEGQTWSFIGYHLNFTTSMAVSENTILIGGFLGLGLYRSTNGGVSFEIVEGGFPNSGGIINSIAKNDQTFYATIGGEGIFRSTDSGMVWEEINSGLPQVLPNVYHEIKKITVIGGKPYAVTNSSLYKFEASTWTNLSLTQNVHDISGNETLLLSVTRTGVWRSTNDGVSWIESNEQLLATRPLAFAKIDNRVFAAIPWRIASTTDNGLTWDFPSNFNASDLLSVENILFARSFDGVFRSTDEGSTWVSVNNGITENLSHISDINSSGNVLYSSFYNIHHFHTQTRWVSGGVFRSTNNGNSWIAVNSGFPTNEVGVVVPTYKIAANGQTIFAATYEGMFRSLSGGGSWGAAHSGLPTLRGFSALYNSSLFVVVGTSQGIYRFNGSSWIPINSGLPQIGGSYPSVLSFIEYEGILYASSDNGVYKFNGTNWSAVGSGLPEAAILCLIENNGELLAGVSNNGVWSIPDVIPVELSSFTALISGNTVELNWTTATELNNRIFEIERRPVEGQFITIGFVDGNGTTTEAKSYSYIDRNLNTGNYSYRLKQIDFDGTFEYSNEIEVEVLAPNQFSLEQNYPNPFNPSTIIKFSIMEKIEVNLSVYNILGEKIGILVNETKEAGYYEINFNAEKLSSGIYLYQLRAGNNIQTMKMIVVK